jgi:16S rRNA (cytosine967-C5)-methyltransferase
MSSSNPRRAAVDILLRVEQEVTFADQLIDRELAGDFLQGPDRGLFTELVYGVLRRQGNLDHIIRQFSTQPPEKLQSTVRILLRTGLYQMFYLDRVPVSAAVNETVKLAAEMLPRAKGFINAVLRSADRGRDSIVYPDRELDRAGYLAARYSHPRWLAEQWLRQLGPAEAEELASIMAEQPPLTARVNTLKLTRDDVAERLAAGGITATPCRYSSLSLKLAAPGTVEQLPGFREGLFTIQDESSQLAALLLDPQPGERVLDLCAAPGGKATAIAQLMEDRGVVTACDLSDAKLCRVTETAARLGISIISTVRCDAADPPAGFREGYDRVLVDAPCSGLGVIRRNPEGKWRKGPEDLARLALSQKKILKAAATCVAPGGLLLYATCSTSEVENEAVIDDFLARNSDFVLERGQALFPAWDGLFTERGMFRSWPHRHGGMDGFFAARLRKTAVN